MHNNEYDAELVRVVEGDTVVLQVNLGFDMFARIQFRLHGVRLKDPSDLDNRKAARQRLESFLQMGPIYVIPWTRVRDGWLGTVFVSKLDGTILNVNSNMIASGFAVAY